MLPLITQVKAAVLTGALGPAMVFGGHAIASATIIVSSLFVMSGFSLLPPLYQRLRSSHSLVAS